MFLSCAFLFITYFKNTKIQIFFRISEIRYKCLTNKSGFTISSTRF